MPRVPHPRFVGQSAMGPRGDAIAQLDWCVGEILAALDRLKLTGNTLVIFTSDNAPVADDGYKDDAVEKLGHHKPAGPFRGGKYSNFEGGTRVPFIARWPGKIKRGVAHAPVSQIDFPASLAAFTGRQLAQADAPDSFNVMDALLGKTQTGRNHLVEQAGALSLRRGQRKFIAPGRGPELNRQTNTESGNDSGGQLYNLAADPSETRNVVARHPDRMKAMNALLEQIKQAGRSRPE